MLNTLTPTQLPPHSDSVWRIVEDSEGGKKIYVLKLIGSGSSGYEIASAKISDFDLTMQTSVFGKKPQEVVDTLAKRIIDSNRI